MVNLAEWILSRAKARGGSNAVCIVTDEQRGRRPKAASKVDQVIS
jgi:hypothetical protein